MTGPAMRLVSLMAHGADWGMAHGAERGTALPFPVAATWILDPQEGVEALMARLGRWIAQAPPAWIVAQGGSAALLLGLVQRRPGLRIAGVALISPKAWVGAERFNLPIAPLPFPVLLAERAAGRLPAPIALVRAWGARSARQAPSSGRKASSA